MLSRIVVATIALWCGTSAAVAFWAPLDPINPTFAECERLRQSYQEQAGLVRRRAVDMHSDGVAAQRSIGYHTAKRLYYDPSTRLWEESSRISRQGTEASSRCTRRAAALKREAQREEEGRRRAEAIASGQHRSLGGMRFEGIVNPMSSLLPNGTSTLEDHQIHLGYAPSAGMQKLGEWNTTTFGLGLAFSGSGLTRPSHAGRISALLNEIKGIQRNAYDVYEAAIHDMGSSLSVTDLVERSRNLQTSTLQIGGLDDSQPDDINGMVTWSQLNLNIERLRADSEAARQQIAERYSRMAGIRSIEQQKIAEAQARARDERQAEQWRQIEREDRRREEARRQAEQRQASDFFNALGNVLGNVILQQGSRPNSRPTGNYPSPCGGTGRGEAIC